MQKVVCIAEGSAWDGIDGKNLPEGLSLIWCSCSVACSCDIRLALLASLISLSEEKMWFYLHESWNVGLLGFFRQSLLLAMTLALTVAFLQEHEQRCLVTVECMSTAILASPVTKCGYHYQSLQTVAGMPSVPMMLCWEHEPLSEGIFWEKQQILATSSGVFKTQYRNKWIPAAPLGWQGAIC